LTDVSALSTPFDYAIPENFEGPVELGSRVRVPLHGRSVKGWIVAEPEGEVSELKTIKSSLGFGPTTEILELARWASWRWNGPWARFVDAASPETIVRSLPTPPTLGEVNHDDTPLARLGRAGGTSGAHLVQLGPVTDPFDLLLGFISTRSTAGTIVILVPGLGYAGRLAARLNRRGVAAVNVQDAWPQARAGWPVVVGTRTAAFAPVPALGGMVVLDAEDERYFSEGAPTWNALDVARHRCSDVPLVVVSSCPDARVSHGLEELRTPEVQVSNGWPRVHVVDQVKQDPREGILSRDLVELGRRALEEQPDGIAVACILNRKGRARLVICKSCDQVARCAACDAACSLEEDLGCPRCGSHRPIVCAHCGATAMKLLRRGTSQLVDECEALFGVPTVEVTAQSDRAALSAARVVVGTEAIVHRVRSARLVAFLDLDHHLLAPRAGAELRALTVIAMAGRLVGPRSSPQSGSVLVQTRLADHPVIASAVSGNPSAVIDADREVRAMLGLPPFGAVAELRGSGAEAYARALDGDGVEGSSLGDGEGLARAAQLDVLADRLASVARPKEGVRVRVDPESL
jgi:primosomal protein N' (replication factor Y) (superfamily II helicase)